MPVILPEKVDMCPAHPTKPLELYCKCEEVLICRDCIIRKHKDHDYDVISDVVEGEKKILREALPDIQQLVGDVSRVCCCQSAGQEEGCEKERRRESA